MKLPNFFKTVKDYTVDHISQLLTSAKFIKDHPKILIALLPTMFRSLVDAAILFVEPVPSSNKGIFVKDHRMEVGYNHTNFLRDMAKLNYAVTEVFSDPTCNIRWYDDWKCLDVVFKNCGISFYSRAAKNILTSALNNCLNPSPTPDSLPFSTVLAITLGTVGGISAIIGLALFLTSGTFKRCFRQQSEENNPLLPRLEP